LYVVCEAAFAVARQSVFVSLLRGCSAEMVKAG